MSLNEYNKIRLINSNYNLNQQVKTAIMQNWPPGMYNESDYCGSAQFELNGHPFTSFGSNYQVYVCVLMLHILNTVELNGLKLLLSSSSVVKKKLILKV